MKYIANPVVVDAYKIVYAELVNTYGNSFNLKLDNGDTVLTTPDMCSRYDPVIGDYWVIQSDGYTYLNPAEVFERKYSPVEKE